MDSTKDSIATASTRGHDDTGRAPSEPLHPSTTTESGSIVSPPNPRDETASIISAGKEQLEPFKVVNRFITDSESTCWDSLQSFSVVDSNTSDWDSLKCFSVEANKDKEQRPSLHFHDIPRKLFDS
jgi:hypothetical protein